MNTLMQLASEPLVGTLLGILGLVVAIAIYIKTRRVAQIAYQHSGITLIGSSHAAFPDEIEITFSGAKVPQVTAEKVVIWNSGNTTISGQDITKVDPLRIQIDDGQILKVTNIKATRSVNRTEVVTRNDEARNTIDITFDFYDQNDGVSFEVIHSGGSRGFKLLGTIRGIPKGVTPYSVDRLSFFPSSGKRTIVRRLYRIIYTVAMVIGMAMIITGFVLPNVALKMDPLFTPGKPVWPIIFAGLFYAGFPCWIFWSQRRRYPATLEFESIAARQKA